jgi:hypothetical protein
MQNQYPKSSAQMNHTSQLNLIYGIVSGLSKLHQKGIIHGKIKPSMLLDENGEPIIDGTGLPPVINYANPDATKSLEEMRFTAPEVLMHRRGGYSADVYSVGVLMYVIKTGQGIFPEKKKRQDFVNMIKRGRRPGFPENFPQKWKDLISQCWDSDPSKRPSMFRVATLLSLEKELREDFVFAIRYPVTQSITENSEIGNTVVPSKASPDTQQSESQSPSAHPDSPNAPSSSDSSRTSIPPPLYRPLLELSDSSASERFRPSPAAAIDDARLRAIMFELWRCLTVRPLGEPAVLVFRFLAQQSLLPGIDSSALHERTFALLSAVQSSIRACDWESAFAFFANCHRLDVLLDRPSAGLSAFAWAVAVARDNFAGDFRTCTRMPQSSHLFTAALARIRDSRERLRGRIGAFFWGRVVAAIDRVLANELVGSPTIATEAQMRETIAHTEEFECAAEVKLPVFVQGMALVLEYETIIANKIPLGQRVGGLPPAFFAALVFAGKRKRMIKLEISDRPILKWIGELGIDVRDILRPLDIDETATEVPLDLW